MTLSSKIPVFFSAAAFLLLPAISVFSAGPYGVAPPVFGALLFLTAFIVRKKTPPLDRPLLLWLTAIIFLGAISSFWAMESGKTFESSLRVALLFAGGTLFLSACSVIDDTHRKKIAGFLPYAYIGAMIFFCIERGTNDFFYRLFKNIPDETRLPDSLTNHGLVVLTLLLFPVLRLLADTQGKKMVIAFYTVHILILFFLGESETALLATLAGGGMICFAFFFHRSAFFITTAASVLGILSAPWIARYSFEHLSDKAINWFGITLAMRLEIWDAVAAYTLKNPLWGHGMEACRRIKDFNFEHLYYQRDTLLHPHNMLLQVWLEFGLTGALLASGFVALILLRLSRLPFKDSVFAFSLFAAVSGVALIGYGLWQGWWIGLLFMMTATFQLVRQEEKSRAP